MDAFFVYKDQWVKIYSNSSHNADLKYMSSKRKWMQCNTVQILLKYVCKIVSLSVVAVDVSSILPSNSLAIG